MTGRWALLLAAAAAALVASGAASAALRARAISAGGNHTCAIALDGTLACWGSDDEGQLGDGAQLRDRSTPGRVQLPAGARVEQVSSGEHHSCALLGGGSAVCWGEGRFGRLGDGNLGHVTRATPVRVRTQPGQRLVSLAAGTYHTCGLLASGAVLCWGQDVVGQLGDDPALRDTGLPRRVALPQGRRAIALTSGASHSCVILEDGVVSCWGWALDGRLGDGSRTGVRPIPVRVDLPAGRRAVSISAGGFHTCAVLDDGSAVCWGSDDEGQLGDGDAFVDQPRPVAVALPPGSTAVAVAAGDHHTCALLDRGDIVCWGSDADGRLGNTARSDRERVDPDRIALPGRVGVIALTAGFEHTCALAAGGAAFCWGSDSDGQLGDGGPDRDRPQPVSVAGRAL